MEPLEPVISIPFSRSYKREFICEFKGFFIRQSVDEFNVFVIGHSGENTLVVR
jgi:hypothetical protein